jgi:branched-chain amino acid aminotransferase
MAVVWSDGEWVDAGNFSLASSDRGMLLGFALFETMLAVDGKAKFLDAHIGRCKESCTRLGWEFPCIDLESICEELLLRNGLTQGRGRLRLTMTAGTGSIFDKSQGPDSRIWTVATPAEDPPKSIAVVASPWKRNHQSPLTGLKSTSYAENILALDHARGAGYGETLFLNSDNFLCEGATSNVFLIRGNQLFTPSLESGCLPGVTRSVVIHLARQNGLNVVETRLTMEDLDRADEIFLTSAIRGPVPVSRLGGRRFQTTPVGDSVRSWWNDEICRA